ncbi:ATP-binding protein [Microbulbifer yueqingensis]|uniref:histidine kinase n=1 Tax=Microbulbifer yueqingensis TaxID=658219 RepID=A0A1G8UXL0_9GAMM|nr:ATP-binding protein [Microbulbifer yueqingensis]SDJ58307.1 two-component system, OmpR family, sensor kinase/two-component system, OmpR family, sensor histidine kinase CpxA [Microbulbifer yueqingensis]
MRSLFWKMFFGAWLTAMVMVVSTIYITHMGDFGDPRQKERWEVSAMVSELTRNMRRARRHGPEHFRYWLGRQPREFRDRVFALGPDGREILGRPIPSEMAPLFQNLHFRNRELRTLVDNKPTIGFFIPMRERGGLRVAFIAGKSKQELLLLFLWNNFWPILLLSMLASGAVCYWLAKYLSRPLDKLRTATRRVAAGELDYRVAPALQGRGDELADLAHDFDSMTAQLQESMAEQRRLIKDVSHELRSPLARLQVALGIARQKDTRGLEQELEKIGKAADYLEEIIADILSMPVTGSDERKLDDVVEINSLMSALSEDLRDEAEQRGITIELYPCNRELLVATRGSTLTAALENILRNGIKYSPADSRVTATIGAGEASCLVRVVDSGSGVADEDLQAIFRPFYRTDDARTRESGGIGLGLAIAQRTVQQHGGQITASNAAGGGLCVQVELPLVELDM